MMLKTVMTAMALAVGWGFGAAQATPPATETPPASLSPAGQSLSARQAHFKELGATFKAITDELRKAAPDKASAATNAAKLKALAADLPTWFPKGSGPETGLATAARPEIWTDADGFAAAANGFQAEATRLDALSASGDVDAIKAQARVTAGACNSCHDKYRLPEPR